jgi:hypothetical protein
MKEFHYELQSHEQLVQGISIRGLSVKRPGGLRRRAFTMLTNTTRDDTRLSVSWRLFFFPFARILEFRNTIETILGMS